MNKNDCHNEIPKSVFSILTFSIFHRCNMKIKVLIVLSYLGFQDLIDIWKSNLNLFHAD